MTGQATATDLYALLGVPWDADAETIKKAYRRRARALHPDRNPGDPDADAKFTAVHEAYEVLSDTARRREYDQRRHRPRPPPTVRRAPPAAPEPYRPPPSGPGRDLEFEVTARPPSTPDLSAPDRWSRGFGTAAALAAVAATVVGSRGTGVVAAVGTALVAAAVLTLLVLLFVRTGQPRHGRLHLVVGQQSLTFPARRGWRWLGPTARQVAAVGVLGAVLANLGDTTLALLAVWGPWNLLLLVVWGAVLVRRTQQGSAWSLLRGSARTAPPELTITAEGVAYTKGSAFWSCRWPELLEIGTPTLAGATRLTTARSKVRLGAHHLDSDAALVLQILSFYATDIQARHEIGPAAVTRLLRGDFDTPA